MSPGPALSDPSHNGPGRWRWSRWLSVPVTVALCAYAAWGVDLMVITQKLSQARLGWLAVAAALVPFEVWLTAERWRIAARGLGIPLSRANALREYALSTWLNQILPGGVVGDVLRVWRTGSGRLGRAAMAAGIDRWVGLWVLGMVAMAGLLAWPRVHGFPAPPGISPLIVVLMVGLTGGGLLAWRSVRLRPVLRPGPLLAQVGLSALHTGILLVAFACCGLALQLPTASILLTVIPLLLLAMSVPISIGGWGLREVTATALLPTLGFTAEEALSLSAAYGLTVLVGALPGAGALLIPTQLSEPTPTGDR